MAPIKFEENIREKLQERELTPSPDSWKKLQAQLEEVNPKKKRPFIWYAVAASLVSILVVGGFLLNNSSTVPQEFVEVEVIEPDTPVRGDIVKDAEIALEEVVEKKEAEVVNKQVKKTSVETPRKSITLKSETLAQKETEQSIKTIVEEVNQGVLTQKEQINTETAAVTNEIRVKKEVEVMKEDIKKSTFIDLKVKEVVAQVQNMQTQNNSVTAAEIDALLIKAQRELENQRLLESSTKKIDATALLQSVESEMERGFRDRVFDMLGDGFNKVRTAVAERNN